MITTNRSPIRFTDLTDATARALLIDSSRELIDILAMHDMPRIIADDLSDDDTDYIPARAELLTFLLTALSSCDYSPLDSLTHFLDTDLFADAFTASDCTLSLHSIDRFASLFA